MATASRSPAATAVQPSGAAALLFGRKTGRSRSGQTRETSTFQYCVRFPPFTITSSAWVFVNQKILQRAVIELHERSSLNFKSVILKQQSFASGHADQSMQSRRRLASIVKGLIYGRAAGLGRLQV
jgi:hypothetical protein